MMFQTRMSFFPLLILKIRVTKELIDPIDLYSMEVYSVV